MTALEKHDCRLGDMITDPDKTKAKRVAEEMLKQVKFDIAKLEAAFQGS